MSTIWFATIISFLISATQKEVHAPGPEAAHSLLVLIPSGAIATP
jgi:hypothetical protein